MYKCKFEGCNEPSECNSVYCLEHMYSKEVGNEFCKHNGCSDKAVIVTGYCSYHSGESAKLPKNIINFEEFYIRISRKGHFICLEVVNHQWGKKYDVIAMLEVDHETKVLVGSPRDIIVFDDTPLIDIHKQVNHIFKKYTSTIANKVLLGEIQ